MSNINENTEYMHFEEMLESIPGGGMCVVNDLDLSVVFINDVLLGMLGYTREEFYAATDGKFVKLVYPEDRASVFANAHRSVADNSYSYSYRAISKSGELVWLRESNKMTVAPDGRELVLCIFVDVTDEIRMKEDFAVLVRNMPVAAAVFRTDINDELQLCYISDGFVRLLGYSREECSVIFEHHPMSTAHPEDYAEAKRQLLKALEEGACSSVAFRARHKNGNYVWISVNATYIEENGEKRIYALFNDISPEKKAVEELAYTSKQLQTIVDSAAMLSVSEDFERALNMTLEKIREYFCALRAYMIEFDWEKNTADETFEVCTIGADSTRENFRSIPIEKIRFWFDAMEGDGGITICAQEFDESKTDELKLLRDRGVQKTISVPLRADGRLLGFIGIDAPQTNADDVSLLVILSYFISSELVKYRTQLKMKHSEELLQELILNAPGGLCHFRVLHGKLIPTTVSKGFAKMVGLSEGEELSRLQKDDLPNVHPDDRAGMEEGIEKMLNGATHLSYTARFFNNQLKEYFWIKTDALMVPRGDGSHDLYATFLDVDLEVKNRKEAEARFGKVSEQIRIAKRDAITMNITKHTIDLQNSELVYDEWGFARDGGTRELMDMLYNEVIHKEDRDLFINAYNAAALEQSYAEGQLERSVEVRLKTKNKWRWNRVYVRLDRNPETNDLLAIFWTEDIHRERQRLAIISKVSQLDYDYISIVNTKDNRYTMFAYNQKSTELSVLQGSDYETEIEKSIDAKVLPEDREMAKRNASIPYITARLKTEDVFSYNIKIRMANGDVLIKNIKFAWLDEETGSVLCLSSDITDAVAEEQKMGEAISMLLTAVGQNHMSVWTYDFDTRSVSFGEQSCDSHALAMRGMLYPEEYVQQGFVHPDDGERFLDMLRRVHEGESVVIEEIRYLNEPGDLDSCRWERTVFSSVMDKNGRPCKAYGSSQDINDRKLMELRFDREMERLRQARSELEYPAYIAFNATKDIIIDHEPGGFPVQTIPAGRSLEEERRQIRKMNLNENDMRLFGDCFDRELILSTFRDGGSQIVREYRRPGKDPGSIIWARSTVNIAQDPASADIICFGYTADITEERTREAVLDTMLSDEYEYVMYIDLKNDSFKTYANKYGGTLLPADSGEYSSMIRSFVKDCYVKEDIEKILHITSPEGIRRQLKYADSFEAVGRTVEEDGSHSYKKLRCGYIDKGNDIVYCYRMDITDLLEKEQEQKEALAAALQAEERANNAKSRFLTRMSRDMRTPMNEVLGLTRLTLERDDLTPETRENIEQVAKSANYLHDLINDVLDLSKIESGEIILHLENVAMADMFGELINSSRTLALEEGVIFAYSTEGAESDTVLIDKLRVWQIFSKLLSSAIRLSKKGGEVTFEAKRLERIGDLINFKFTLCDSAAEPGSTLAELFETSMDETREISDDFDAMGVAMPIIRSLIEKMGGSMAAETLPDGSSRITVYLGFKAADTNEEQNQAAADYSLLSGKRVLLVDDHPTNLLVATKLLESRGIEVETAENGQMAVSMFENADCCYYDAVLMDVRMPVMNGLEATRRIRASEKSDAGSVPIIAMTANAFEEDVRASHDAGMNEHLSKPIEPMRLFDSLCRCIKG